MGCRQVLVQTGICLQKIRLWLELPMWTVMSELLGKEKDVPEYGGEMSMEKHKKAREKKNFKDLNLSRKVATVLVLVLIVSFTIMSVILALYTKSTLSSAVDADFSSMAEGNASRIQGIIDETTLVAENMQTYIEREYDRGGTMTDEQKGVGTSMLYGHETNGLNASVESYMINEMWSTIRNSENILGMGFQFEPYQYDAGMESFSTYLTEEDAENLVCKPFADYDTYSKEVYYSIPKETGKPYFTEPYEFDGIRRVIAAYPIMYQGKFQGSITINIILEKFGEGVKISSEYPTMYGSLFTENGVNIYDTHTEEYIGKGIDVFFGTSQKSLDEIKAGFAAGKEFSMQLKDDSTATSLYFVPIQAGEEKWWSLTAVENADKNSDVVGTVVAVVLISVIILVLVTAITVVLLRQSLSPLKSVVTAANTIAAGDFDVELAVESQDEIGQLMQAFDDMAARMKFIIMDLSYLLGNMADGNFKVESKDAEAYVGQYKDIYKAGGRINVSLSQTLRKIYEVSEQVSGGSEHVAGASQGLAQGASEQAASVEELNASVNEMAEQVKKSTKNADMAKKSMDETQNAVQVGNTHMQEMVAAMEKIKEASSKIQQIVKTIEDIASQTNLLSLNAAIEAARAGEAGKGFAVVAEEVKSLAEESALATKDIVALIENSIQAVEEGGKVAGETSEALHRIVESADEVSAMVEEISAAGRIQEEYIGQIGNAVEQISGVVQSNAATAEQSAASSEELSAQAEMARNLLAGFQIRDDA